MSQYTAEQLKNLSKEAIISLLLDVQQENLLMSEKISVLQADKFGRKTESLSSLDMDQLSFFNEVEAAQDSSLPEPTIEEVTSYKRKRPAGKREEDMSKLPRRIVNHELSEEKLISLFGENGWKQLPDQVYTKLEMHPAVYEAVEHHVAVYASKDNQTIIKADRPAELLSNSVASPSLVAGIMNAKYTNALPLYRIAQEFERNDLAVSRQTMSNWIIRCAERYLSLIYEGMRKQLCSGHVIQADETPVTVTKDGRATGSKSYMWLYRSGDYSQTPVVLYEYQKTRNTQHPTDFLKDFAGVLVCDGYSAYHKLDRENNQIQVANCWAHARRRYANALKAFKGTNKQAAKKSLASKALTMIAKIYETDEKGADMTPENRKEYRQQEVLPLVEAYFAWVNEHRCEVAPKSETGEGFTYSLNQRKYLEVFLEDGTVPMDNSLSERSIRPFTIGRKNWVMIDTVHGANASAIIYSMVETAKANNLKPYEYLKHLLTEIPKHMDDTDTSFVADLLPWSPQLPQICRKTTS